MQYEKTWKVNQGAWKAIELTVKALLSGFEFEKQKYMTIYEIKAKAEMLLKNSRESQGEFVQMYNNGFEDGVNFVLQNLQQCNVSCQCDACKQDRIDSNYRKYIELNKNVIGYD